MENLRPLLRSLGLVLAVASLPSAMAAEPDFRPPPEFAAPGKWAAFKTLWQRLDAIPPKNGGTRLDARSYGVLTQEQEKEANVLVSALCEVLGDEAHCPKLFDNPEKTQSLETQMLIKLVQLRIRLLIGNCCGETLLTRMMPPPIETERFQFKRQQAEQLQERAHALAKLRQRGQINEAIAARTLESLQRNARLALHLGELPRGCAHFARRPNQSEPVVAPSNDLSMPIELQDARGWDERAEKWLAQIECGQETRDRLAALRTAHSRLDGLLAELER